MPHEGSLLQRFYKSMNSGIGQMIWKLLVVALGFVVAGFAWQATNMANAFIAKNPSVTAAVQAAQQAKDAVAVAKDAAADAKSTAERANEKADQISTGVARIYDAIKAVHEDVQTMKITAASSSATMTAQITALGKQVDRIELKQDSGR